MNPITPAVESFSTSINSLIGSLSGVSTFLLLLASISILTTAIVDVFKPWIRPIIVKKHFIQWFNPTLGTTKLYLSLLSQDKTAETEPNMTLLNSLLSKAVGSNIQSFYRLKLDVLFTQLDIAVNSLLDYPDANTQDLLVILSGYKEGVSNVKHKEDIEMICNGPEEKDPQNYLKALTRLNRQIEGNLSIFRNNLELRWARNLHILSFFLSLLMMIASYSVYKGSIGFLPFLIISIIGAFLAPVAHNLASAIQEAKGKITK